MLARIALRSLGRFVTTMHKSFPVASGTIIRRQAIPGQEGGGVIAGDVDGGEEVKWMKQETVFWSLLSEILGGFVFKRLWSR